MELCIKFLILSAIILNSIYVSNQQQRSKTTPEERCIGEGDRVCLDCFTFGFCAEDGNGNFSIVNEANCDSPPEQPEQQFYCDDSFFATGPFGMCSPYRPEFTNCSCTSQNMCIEDPNNPRVILRCGNNTAPSADTPCSVPALNLTDCSCSSCSTSCPLLDDPTDDCGKFYFCAGGEQFIPSECKENLCFDQESCTCMNKTETTTDPTPAANTSTSTTTAMPSTTEMQATPTTTAMQTTPPTTAMQTTPPTTAMQTTPPATAMQTTPTTAAMETTPTTTAMPSTPTMISTTTSPTTTATSTTTSTPTTSITPTTTTTPRPRPTCRPGCPYADNPEGHCRNFFVCDRGSLIPLSCPGSLCFDHERCICRP